MVKNGERFLWLKYGGGGGLRHTLANTFFGKLENIGYYLPKLAKVCQKNYDFLNA